MKAKSYIYIIFFSIFCSVYLFEFTFEFFKPSKLLSNLDPNYDYRSKIEVIEDFQKSGTEVYPNTFPNLFIESDGLIHNNNKIYPLSTVSNKKVLWCKENGFWLSYKTDQYGFNNPPEVYKDKIDIILTGDSFAEGACVLPNQNIASNLNKNNIIAVSIGKGSNGPLTEYAALREYAVHLKPKIVLWVYYVNDLKDLQSELKSNFLKNYLIDDEFSQNLIKRQNEIDTSILKYMKTQLENLKNENSFKNRIKNVLILNRTNKFINRSLRQSSYVKTNNKEYNINESLEGFKKIIKKADNLVSNWGGKMYFVYLPSYTSYASNIEDKNRLKILKIINELKIELIDIHEEVFKNHQDPLSLFPYRINNHYNPEGYKLLSDAIFEKIVDNQRQTNFN